MNSQYMRLNQSDVAVITAQIDVTATEIARLYDDLAPTQKARVLELANGMSALRRKLNHHEDSVDYEI